MPNKSGLDNMLQSVLSIANEEQSAIYPPSIFSQHYNIATSFLLDSVVKAYPDRPFLVDIIDPFVKASVITVNNGLAKLPDDYRNILGSPYVFTNPKNTGPCGDIPEIKTPSQFQSARNTAACNVTALVIVSQAEFSIRTNSTYNYPTYEQPIAFFYGKNTLKICPYDIPKITLLYTQQEDIYQYGYILQPDDTYLFDSSTTVDGLWTDAAFAPLFKAITHLYGIYSRDQEVKEWATLLSQISIV